MEGILKENIIVGLEADNKEDAIRKISELLTKNGHIKMAYSDDVIKREKEYPTGLPTEGVKIAIPHATSDAIIDSTIAFATLKSPVVFQNMGDESESLDVEMIFLIANSAAAEQTVILQSLMINFSDEDVLMKLKNVQSVDEAAELIYSL